SLGRHAAGWNRHAWPQSLTVFERHARDLPAGLGRVPEASAMVGEDDGVRTQHAEKLAEEEGGRDARRPGHGGVSEKGKGRMFPHQPVEIRKATDHWRDHDGVESRLLREHNLP